MYALNRRSEESDQKVSKWFVAEEVGTRLRVVETKMLRWTDDVTHLHRIRSGRIRQRLCVTRTGNKLRGAPYHGHVARLDDHSVIRQDGPKLGPASKATAEAHSRDHRGMPRSRSSIRHHLLLPSPSPGGLFCQQTVFFVASSHAGEREAFLLESSKRRPL